MKTYLSIIVPVYNSEETLSECLESLTFQTLKDIEIVIVDDGSTDNSRKIIERFANEDARVKPIYQEENHGVSKARNVGVQAAIGSYVTFVDSDDWVEKEMYENLYSLASKYDTEVVFSDLVFEYPDCKSQVLEMNIPSDRVLFKNDIKEHILPTFLNDGRFGNPIKLYKKGLLEKNGIKFPEDRSLGEDFYFNLEVFTYCESVYYVDKPHYHYRQSNSDSLMNKYRPELYDLYLNNSPIEGYFKKWGMYSNEVKYELSKRKCYVAANGCIQNEFKADCKNSFREKLKIISKVVNHQDVQESAFLLLKYEKNKKKRIYLNMLKHKNVIGLFIMGKLLFYR